MSAAAESRSRSSRKRGMLPPRQLPRQFGCDDVYRLDLRTGGGQYAGTSGEVSIVAAARPDVRWMLLRTFQAAPRVDLS